MAMISRIGLSSKRIGVSVERQPNINNLKEIYMKKIMVMLLSAVVAVNAMAVTYTAKAKLTLTAGSSYTCNLMIAESADFAELTGSEMDMEDREVALYVLNGATKLQIAQAADLRNVKVGLKTDASTSYNITVSMVEGDKPLFLHDNVTGEDIELKNGASYDFTATASSTIENRFWLKRPTAELDACFIDNVLTISNNPWEGPIKVTKPDGTAITPDYPAGTSEIDLSDASFPVGNYTVEFNGAHKIVVVKK